MNTTTVLPESSVETRISSDRLKSVVSGEVAMSAFADASASARGRPDRITWHDISAVSSPSATAVLTTATSPRP